MAEAASTTEKPKVEAAESKAKNAGTLPEAKRPPGDLRRRTRKDHRDGPFVKYVGTAAIRKITPPQWKSLNIALQNDDAEHSWTVANDKMLEANLFSDAQLDYLLIDDLQQGSGAHAFLLVDYDSDGDDAQLVQVAYE